MGLPLSGYPVLSGDLADPLPAYPAKLGPYLLIRSLAFQQGRSDRLPTKPLL